MKTVEEFVKAMETTEMQEAFEKFAEGKTVATAEDADKLVKEFAAENGFDISEGTVEFIKSDEELSEEELANIAGGRGFRGEKMILAAGGIRDVDGKFLKGGIRDDNGLYKGLIRDENLVRLGRADNGSDNAIRLGKAYLLSPKEDGDSVRLGIVVL